MSYPILLLRIKALLLDSLILGILLFVMIYLSLKFDITDPVIKTCFILLPIILLEPSMIWLTGGSFGHHYSGIRIIDKTSGENLFILNGILRFVIKSILGALSLLTMFTTKRHQAIHDYLSNSVVVFKNEHKALPRHKIKERQVVYNSSKPSFWRRIVVIAVYLLLTFLLYSVILSILLSSRCLDSGICTTNEDSILGYSGLLFLAVLLIEIVLGFTCKLPGAYHRAAEK